MHCSFQEYVHRSVLVTWSSLLFFILYEYFSTKFTKLWSICTYSITITPPRHEFLWQHLIQWCMSVSLWAPGCAQSLVCYIFKVKVTVKVQVWVLECLFFSSFFFYFWTFCHQILECGPSTQGNKPCIDGVLHGRCSQLCMQLLLLMY